MAKRMMTPDEMKETAHEIVDAIAKDIEGRKGIGNEFEGIDEETREEMLETWRDAIYAVLHG